NEKALEYYAAVMKEFPHDNRPYYESAIVYFKKNDVDKAIALLMQSALMNPNHFRTHWLLGICYYSQGRLTESFLALQYSLATTSQLAEASKSFGAMHSLTVQDAEISNNYNKKNDKYSHYLFDEIDELIHAKIALSKDFKVKGKVDD